MCLSNINMLCPACISVYQQKSDTLLVLIRLLSLYNVYKRFVYECRNALQRIIDRLNSEMFRQKRGFTEEMYYCRLVLQETFHRTCDTKILKDRMFVNQNHGNPKLLCFYSMGYSYFNKFTMFISCGITTGTICVQKSVKTKLKSLHIDCTLQNCLERHVCHYIIS